MYDLDAESANKFESFTRAFDRLAETAKVWNIQTTARQADWKRHAGATTSVTRSTVSFRYTPPAVIQTNIAVPAIVGGRQSLYFFPDIVLVLEGKNAGVVNYKHFKLSAGSTRFVESERVPSDAQIATYTWRYVNKNAGPDRRFNNNRQLPVVNYQELDISSTSGLHKLLQISRVEDRGDLIRSAADLGKLAETLSAAAASAGAAYSQSQAPPDGRGLAQNTASDSLPAPLSPSPNPETSADHRDVPFVASLILLSVTLVLLVGLMYPLMFHKSLSTELERTPRSPVNLQSIPNPNNGTSTPSPLRENAKKSRETLLLRQVRSIPASHGGVGQLVEK
jgi:hypothetical protein